MSKYIRTNDGRIIDTTKERETELCNQRAWCPKKGFVVYENDIIKQADTIEKLCDEFVLINKNIDLLPSIEKSYHDFSPYLDVDIRRHEKPSYIEIYGQFGLMAI